MTTEGAPRRQELMRYDLLAPKPPEGAIDLTSLVPGEGELELDIGFGRGRSLRERAKLAPTSRIIGIEVKTKWATKVEERVKSEGLVNARVLCGDAREILARSGPDACVRRVFVHFPDPWWKKKHAHRMVIGDAFLDTLARLMVPGGDVYVQTDVEARAMEYIDALRTHEAFMLSTDTGLVEENPFGARSNRERRAIEDGMPVFRILAFRKGIANTAQTGRCG